VDTVTLSEAKAQLPRLLTEIMELGEGIVITRSGRPAGVLVSIEEYEGLLETLEILADAELAAAVREGLDDVAAARVVTHTELWSGLGD
jgi:prevent-host-death family protein